MKPQLTMAFPFIAGLTVGALAVAVIIGTKTPATWEECMVGNLEKAHTKSAINVLNSYCKEYPRRS